LKLPLLLFLFQLFSSSFSPCFQLAQESTAAILWLFEPVREVDQDATFPSLAAVTSGGASGSNDVKYWHHRLLASDIRK
jgi:hypothetical protein